MRLKKDLSLLHCPSCGWEDSRLDKLDKNANRTQEYVQSSDITVPCPEYANKLCDRYQRSTIDNMYQPGYTVPCPSFPHIWPSYPDFSDTLKNHIFYPQNDQQAQAAAAAAAAFVSKPQLCTREMQLSNEQLVPEKLTRQAEANVGDPDKGIQNTICVSKASVAPAARKRAIALQRKSCQGEGDDAQGKCHKEVQSESSAREDSREVAVNTVVQCDKGAQKCTASEKATSTIEEAERADENAAGKSESDARGVIGIRLTPAEGCKNFLLITIDGNYTPLMHVDPKSEQFAIDKCRRDVDELKRDEKGTVL